MVVLSTLSGSAASTRARHRTGSVSVTPRDRIHRSLIMRKMAQANWWTRERPRFYVGGVMISNTCNQSRNRLAPLHPNRDAICGRVGWKIFVLIIFVISVSPIAWYRYLPLADYPNDLARLQLHKTFSLNPYLSQFFEFSWSLAPYLGFGLIAWPFMYYLPVELSKVVIIISFGMLYGGTILLDRQLNPHNWGLSLFSCIFLYNGALKYGFLTYLIGVGFAICAFWVWVRNREKADTSWFLVFVSLGALVCLMHPYAFGIYAAITLLVPVLGVLLWFNPISNSSGLMVWGNPVRKVEALTSPIFYCDPVSEIPLLLVVVSLFAWALATRTIVANRQMVIPLTAFASIFILMPVGLFGSAYAYYRLPSAVTFIAMASFGWGKTSSARINLVCLLLAACLIIRVCSVFSDCQPTQKIIGEYDTALRSVPPESRLMVVARRTFWGDRKPPLRHVPVLAAAKQSVFDPRTFTGAFQLLKLRPEYRGYWDDDSAAPSGFSDFQKFDYLMEIREPPVNIPAGITLEEIVRGLTFVLYQIKQQKASSS